MKLTRLDIQGFKSLKNVSWRPGAVNVVIGPNASGKSNLIQSLELLAESAAGRLTKWTNEHGGLDSLMWDSSTDVLKILVETAPPHRPKGIDEFSYEVSLLSVQPGHHMVLQEKLVHRSVRHESEIESVLLEVGPDAYKLFNKATNELEELSDRYSGEETLLSLLTSPLEEGKYPARRFRGYLVQPLVFRTTNAGPDSAFRKPFVTSREAEIDASLRTFSNVLHTLYTTNRTFEEAIKDGMSAAFRDFDRLIFSPDAGDRRTQLRIRWKSRKRDDSAADLSDGTLRFLFLLTLLAHPNPPPLIAIDEPETGLHPEMFPILADYANAAAEKTQLIFTTHSPEFLNGFPRAAPPTVTVTELEDGETKLRQVEGEELARWLGDFSLGEIFSDLEAIAR